VFTQFNIKVFAPLFSKSGWVWVKHYAKAKTLGLCPDAPQGTSSLDPLQTVFTQFNIKVFAQPKVKAKTLGPFPNSPQGTSSLDPLQTRVYTV